jgi:hypothetical protein
VRHIGAVNVPEIDLLAIDVDNEQELPLLVGRTCARRGHRRQRQLNHRPLTDQGLHVETQDTLVGDPYVGERRERLHRGDQRQDDLTGRQTSTESTQ